MGVSGARGARPNMVPPWGVGGLFLANEGWTACVGRVMGV